MQETGKKRKKFYRRVLGSAVLSGSVLFVYSRDQLFNDKKLPFIG